MPHSGYAIADHMLNFSSFSHRASIVFVQENPCKIKFLRDIRMPWVTPDKVFHHGTYSAFKNISLKSGARITIQSNPYLSEKTPPDDGNKYNLLPKSSVSMSKSLTLKVCANLKNKL